MPTLKLALAAALVSAAAPMVAYAAPGDITSGGGQGGKGGDSSSGNGGGGGAGGLAGGGGGGGGGQGVMLPSTSVDGGGGGSGAPLGGAAGPGANGGNFSSAGGFGGQVLGGDASSGGGGGGGAGGIAGPGGAGGNSLSPSGNVSGSLDTVLSGAVGGTNGDAGSAGISDAGGGGGGGGQGGLVLTGANAVLSTGGTSVAGGTGGAGNTAIGGPGGGGGGGAGVVLVSGGTIQHDGSVIVGGTGGAAGLGPDSGGGGGGAGVFLVDGGTLFNNAGTVQGGLGGDATSGAGGLGGAAVLANRGAVNNAASLRGGGGATGAAAGTGGDAIVANGTAIANDAAGQIIGGRGGDAFGPSGQPGNGGAGVRFINTGGSLRNSGIIFGGAAGSPAGVTLGAGGAGVIVQGGVTVANSGTIVGAMDSFNGNRANAVELSGGANRLTLQAGSTILGNVVSTSGATLGGDVLALGGDTTDASTTFNVGQIGAVGAAVQYQGFNAYEKTGASTWTLTGSTAGVTPWTLSGGTLVIGADAALGDVSGALTFNGGTLRNTAAIDTARSIAVGAGGGTLDTPQPLALQGALSGNGALAKTGAGTLTLNGASTYTGAFALQAGKLVVGDATHAGAILPGIVTVGNGATLGGQGTVGGAVIGAGGIVAPGNSIGTLHVTGDFAMVPGAVYQVEADSTSSASDRIVVGGTATLAGSVVHVGPDGNFSLARDYTIVTAAGGLHGAFNSVASNYAFLDPKLSYGANDVTLRMQLKQVPGNGGSDNGGGDGGSGSNGGDGDGGGDGGTRPIRFADAAETGNQRATANAVQSLPQDNAVYSRVLNLPVGAPPAAFNALSGEVHASTIGVLQGVSDTVATLPMARLRANLYAGQTAGEPTAQAGPGAADAAVLPRSAAQPVWAQLFGSWRTLDGNGDAGRVRQSDGGLFVGGDRALGAGWRLGGALGYTGSHASLHDRASTADVDSYSATLYGGKAFQAGPGHIEWTAGVAYTWHDIDTRRDTSAAGLADTLKASYHAGTAQAFTELGYRLPVGDRMAVQPFAGVNYSDLRVRGFSESGGVAALDGDSQRSAVTTTTLGLRGELRFESAGMPGRVHAMAGWRHAFGDLDPDTTMAFGDSVPFTVAGAPIAQDAAVMELGIDMRLTKSTTVGVAYNGQLGGGNRQNAGSVNLAWRF